MKVVYVGDFRTLPNWGCRSTGAALASMISERHEIIDNIGVETLQDTGWDKFAQPGIKYGGYLPRAVFDRAWNSRHSHPKFYRTYRWLDARMGAHFDFITNDPDESVRKFHRARKENERLQQIYEAIRSCDAIVINAEGTMIFSNPARRDVLCTLCIIALAYASGKKLFFLNAMFSGCPFTGTDEATVHTAISLLEEADAVTCRDPSSYDFLMRRSDRIKVAQIPDALFTWKDNVRAAAQAMENAPGALLPFGFDRQPNRPILAEPYICISGSSSAYRASGAAIEAYATLFNEVAKLGLKTYLVCTCIGDTFLDEVAARVGATVIPWTIPVMSGAAILANARLFISGRFHPSILASLGGTPCVFLGANSHKTLSLQSVLDYPDARIFNDVPSGSECKVIRHVAETTIRNGDGDRSGIRMTVDRLARQAATVKDVLNGATPLPLKDGLSVGA